MKSTLGVDGIATFNNKVKIADTVDVSGNMTLQQGNTFTTGNLYFNDNGTESSIRTTNGNLMFGPTDVSKFVHIPANLIVDGSINFTGAITQTNVNIQVTDQLDISANGATALKVTQVAGPSYKIADFASSGTSMLTVDGYGAVIGDITVAANDYYFGNSDYALQVAGNAHIGRTLNTKDLTVQQSLTVTSGNVQLSTGDLEIVLGNLKVDAGLTDIQNLKVNTTSTFDGVATFNAGIVLGNTFFDQW